MVNPEITSLRKGMRPRKKAIRDNLEEADNLMQTDYLTQPDEIQMKRLLQSSLKIQALINGRYSEYLKKFSQLSQLCSQEPDQTAAHEKEQETHVQFELEVEGKMLSMEGHIKMIETEIDRINQNPVIGPVPMSQYEKDMLAIESQKLKVEEAKLQEMQNPTAPPPSKPKLSVKLPKYEIPKFQGGILEWQSWWDSFTSAVDNNPDLKPVEKMNYLKCKLEGEALKTIQGFSLTDANYKEAIRVLKQRYSDENQIINAHFSELAKLPPCSHSTSALRITFDQIEVHLRSLEALGEPIETNQLVTTIMAKLPENVTAHLTDQKKDGDRWTVKMLRDMLRKYITSREYAEIQAESQHIPWK